MVWKKFDINKSAALTKSLTEFADLNRHFLIGENPRWTYFIPGYVYYILYGNGWREIFLNSLVFLLFSFKSKMIGYTVFDSVWKVKI